WILHGVAAERPATTSAAIFESAGLSVLASPLERPVETAAEAEQLALAHHAILCAALGEGPVIPARFGQGFIDQATLVEAVEADAVRWRTLMQRLGDTGEFLLRAMPAGVDAADVRSGYLRAQRARRDAERARLERASAAIGAAIDGLSPYLRSHLAPRPARERGGVATGVLLERRGWARAMGEVARRVTQDCTLRLEGPWPAYSFADLPAQGGSAPPDRTTPCPAPDLSRKREPEKTP
ncbi:MAG: GvpL/GvpF family gas vesicle protein, partial [Pseudomonadota bacterium]